MIISNSEMLDHVCKNTPTDERGRAEIEAFDKAVKEKAKNIGSLPGEVEIVVEMPRVSHSEPVPARFVKVAEELRKCSQLWPGSIRPEHKGVLESHARRNRPQKKSSSLLREVWPEH